MAEGIYARSISAAAAVARARYATNLLDICYDPKAMRKSSTATSRRPRLDPRKLPPAFLKFAWEQLWPRERAKVLNGSPKTIWLFGAGASHHYDFNVWGVPVPLANDFIRAMHQLPTSQGFQSHIGPLVSFLQSERGISPDQAPQWSENIEGFMTSIEAGLDDLRRKKQKRELTHEEVASSLSFSMAFNNMSFICANVVNESQNGPLDPVYRTALDYSSPHDTFITFNWDTLLDRALAATGGWSPNTGYGVSFAASLDRKWGTEVAGQPNYQTRWKLLKLHGSVNWLVPHTGVQPFTMDLVSIAPRSKKVFLYWHSDFPYSAHRARWRGGYAPTCYGYYPPNLPVEYFPKQHISAPKGTVILRTTPISVYEALKAPNDYGVPASPLLITPVRQKAYSAYGRTIGSLWAQATKAIAHADRMVVAGYSFPSTDTRAIGLLKEAVRSPRLRTIEIVAPDAANITDRLRKEIGTVRKLTPLAMTLEKYVFGVLSASAPKLMIEAAARHPEIREWLERVFLLQLAALHKSGGIVGSEEVKP